jgi:hypothetical protein
MTNHENTSTAKLKSLTYEQIINQYSSLEDLGEALDSCYDLYELGYTDEKTQERYIRLSEQSFLTIWALWLYFKGTVHDRENYQVVYDELIN